MRNVIHQSVILPAAPEELFEMYIDPSIHKEITGSSVEIGDKYGAVFKAFDGALSGIMLEVIRPSLIVMSWRSVNFLAKDPDSTLILSFTSEGSQGRIDLVHLDVPSQDYEGVNQGWEKYYWTPWRTFLAKK
jgi:uncharacterized protein YndB with AHSA1/START domain